MAAWRCWPLNRWPYTIADGGRLAAEHGTDPDPDFNLWRRYDALWKKLGRPPTREEQLADQAAAQSERRFASDEPNVRR